MNLVTELVRRLLMKKMWMDDTENDGGQTAPEKEDCSSWRWEEWTPES